MADRSRLVSSSSEGDSSGVESWIEWFCKQEGNEFFCEIDRRYIDDNFNLYGLREIVGPNFKKCLDIILDRVETSADETLERQVQDLYGLIHARFILTKRGQDKMRRKMKDVDFGVCPRLPCQQQPVLPVGLKDEIDQAGVMVFCCRCTNVFLPASRCQFRSEDMDLDGAYFGTTFPHLFMMQFPELWPPPPVRVEPYVPRVFGFKVRLPTRPNTDEDTEMQDQGPSSGTTAGAAGASNSAVK